MNEKSRLTWGYARLSVDLGQAGIENQKADIKAYAQVRDWDLPDDRLFEEVARAYVRGGVAARPKFNELLDIAEHDPESFRLVIYNLDRVARDLKDLLRLRAIVDRGAEVHAVTGALDLFTTTGRMTAAVVTSFKEFEVEELRRRIQANKQHAKSRGQYLGGSLRSFGYTDATAQRKIIPREAEILEWIVQELRERDRSWRSITEELRNQGIKSATGRELNQANVSKMMLSPIIYGKMIHEHDDGVRLVDAPWEAILPMDDYEYLKELRVKRTLHRGSHDVGYLLSGALICGVCNTPKRMGSTGPRKYRCRSCNNSISKEIDKLVEKIVLVRLRDWQPEPDQVEGLDLSEENRKLEEYESLVNQGILSKQMYQIGLTEIEESIKRKTAIYERNSNSIPEWMTDGNTIIGMWNTLSMRERRDVVLQVLKSVTVNEFDRRGFGTFQVERLQIEYY